MGEDWITTAEAVALSEYHPDHLRRLIRAEEVEARKFGHVWQVSRRSLLAYLNAAKQSSDKRRGPKPDSD